MVKSSSVDSFLRLIQRSQRGRLKIYLGYCSGVGKTWQMLLEAKRLKENGIDIVAGLVETHESKKNEALLSQMEIIPRKTQFFRSLEISELDIDAILQRHPAVVLIDELAHTNIPGSKHAKRYEDIEEILAAGIHVISTLNIQHLESLFETTEQISGIKVRERLPDRILSQADQLVNVDITPDDLRLRLIEEKNALPDYLSLFLRPENLEQLRELALRELASQIDSRRRNQFPEESQANPDQIMVCLTATSLNSESIIRYASRIAGRLNRNWYVVHIQTLADIPEKNDTKEQNLLADILALAKELGAAVFTYKGDDELKTILQFAREYRVGQIIIGNSCRTLSIWQRLKGRKSVVERLISKPCDICITVMGTRQECTPDETAISEHDLFGKKTNLAVETTPQNEWKDLVMNAKVILLEGFVKKEDAYEQLLHACCLANPDIDKKSALKILFEREQQGSTFVGSEIAIPHGRLKRLNKPVVVIGVTKKGIYDTTSGNTARIIFLMLTPITDPNSHIRILGVISKMASDSRWRSRMLRETGKKSPECQ